ncbi:hypothetical protein PVAG01_08565 [Phlyctema vagabunda]|uniref:DNA-directed RNA polymerase III subunit n=1 Tax=Phlyctema vagabunda TaxID=108571 RepID=A0ABR4PAF1_9HELO
MSRGGRGGARGGSMLKGATWEHDAGLVLPNKPSELFPPYKVPVPAPITEKEKKQIKHYTELREQIHQGPLYTQPSKRDPNAPAKTYGEDQFAERYGAKSKADVDPFVGVPTYSQKYEQKKRVIPQLSGRPFNKELFPKELWSTLEGEEGDEVRAHINRAAKKKALILSGATDAESADKASKLLEKIQKATENEDEDAEGAEEEVIEEDYDYEEDEDEMGGDYDGEQYFDGGEYDDDDGNDNGGGDDY